MRIFISYTGRHGYDGEVAESIAKALERRRVDYFFDRESLAVGDQILPVIERAIEKSCTHFLLLASFASEKVDWVQQELDLAVKHGLQLIPMVIAARENEVPPFVRGLKTLYAPLRREVATLFQFLGLGEPPDLEKERAFDAEFLPALCDRQDEQTAFEQALDECERKLPGAPKFYCLVGEYATRHDLFVDRVREGVLAANARYLSGAADGAPGTVRTVSINWPVKWPRRHRLLPLLEALFRSLNQPWPQEAQLNAAGVAALVGSLRESVLLIRHPIPPERWLPETTKLLMDYLEVWRDAAAAMHQPKEVVVLFDVTWSGAAGDPSRVVVEKAIEAIEEKARRSRTLPPFTPIRFSAINAAHVGEWVSTFPDKALAIRTKEYCRKLFEGAPQRQLDEVIDEYFRALTEATQEKSA
jgi:hypothetical protein